MSGSTTKWKLRRKRWDWARTIWCLLARHNWEVNQRSGQRVCARCGLVVDVTPCPAEERWGDHLYVRTRGSLPWHHHLRCWRCDLKVREP